MWRTPERRTNKEYTSIIQKRVTHIRVDNNYTDSTETNTTEDMILVRNVKLTSTHTIPLDVLETAFNVYKTDHNMKKFNMPEP